jgi:hypothetical protein
VLATYETLTSALLQAPSSPVPLIPTVTLDSYINIARNWVASLAECVRVYGALALTAGTRQYNFSSITFGAALGVAGVYNVRQLWCGVPGTPGTALVAPREFEWMSLYGLNQPVPATGRPKVWSQFAQGVSGSIFLDPIPDIAYACTLDLSCVPENLADDTTPEAIPPLWQQAVPFYAAWFGFMSVQRQADADRMMQRFEKQMDQARRGATPDVLPHQYEQAPDPTTINQLGVPAQGRGQ